MKGNDLVDLQQAACDSNWMRKGYLNKLFSAAEQQYIRYATQPGEMVWLLWSMKEAAYKIDNNFTGTRAFAPLKLNCRIIKISADAYQGEVRADRRLYYTESTVYPGDYIHSIATSVPEGLGLIRSTLLPNESGFDYKAMAPACVSHHGRYLALIF